jgi:hypothetical protein
VLSQFLPCILPPTSPTPQHGGSRCPGFCARPTIAGGGTFYILVRHGIRIMRRYREDGLGGDAAETRPRAAVGDEGASVPALSTGRVGAANTTTPSSVTPMRLHGEAGGGGRFSVV